MTIDQPAVRHWRGVWSNFSCELQADSFPEVWHLPTGNTDLVDCPTCKALLDQIHLMNVHMYLGFG